MTDGVDAPTEEFARLRDTISTATAEYFAKVETHGELALGVSIMLVAAMAAVNLATGLEGGLLAAYMRGNLDGVLDMMAGGGEKRKMN